MPTEEALPGLFDYFQVSSVAELRLRLDDDICAIEVPFSYPPANHIACAFNFAKRDSIENSERTLTAPGFFEDYSDPAAIEDFDWPDPAECIDPDKCRQAVEEVEGDCAKMAVFRNRSITASGSNCQSGHTDQGHLLARKHRPIRR